MIFPLARATNLAPNGTPARPVNSVAAATTAHLFQAFPGERLHMVLNNRAYAGLPPFTSIDTWFGMAGLVLVWFGLTGAESFFQG